jgi:hypothetical protein
MFNFLKQLFSSKVPQKHYDNLFDFRTVSVEEFKTYTNGIKDIYDRKIDGFLIKNVFSQQEVNTILTNLKQLQKSRLTTINDGFSSYPMSFAQVDQSSNNSTTALQEYFQSCVQFIKTFPEVFKVDFEARIQEMLSAISGGRDVHAPIGFGGVGTYTPFNFRNLKPEKGRLKAHCGNYFHKEFPHFFSHLSSTYHVKDQLSYFVMLQPAEKGGELTLFDVEWKEAEIRLTGDTVLQTHEGKLLDLNDFAQVKRMYIKPQAGDMIVFAGGQIWHRVEDVEGSIYRHTLGGFLSVGRDDNSIGYWT